MSAAILEAIQLTAGVSLPGDCQVEYAEGAVGLTIVENVCITYPLACQMRCTGQRNTWLYRGTVWPCSQARLPWGGFIGMALVVSDGFREVG